MLEQTDPDVAESPSTPGRTDTDVLGPPPMPRGPS